MGLWLNLAWRTVETTLGPSERRGARARRSAAFALPYRGSTNPAPIDTFVRRVLAGFERAPELAFVQTHEV